MSDETPPGRASEVFAAFLKLGLTSFGGPVAHLGYFRNEFVERRKWLDEQSYADLVALCQFLPGPASSQVGISIGLLRAGYPGALAAWTAFTFPSALALLLFAYGLAASGNALGSGWLHGLKVAAVAVVALAILGMARTLTPDRARASLAVLALAIALSIPSAWGQIGAILVGAVIGAAFLRAEAPADTSEPEAAGEPGERRHRAFDLRRAAGGVADSGGDDRRPEYPPVRHLLPRRFAGVRRRPCRAAAAAGRGGASRDGSATTPSWPAMARRRRCRGRCSHFPPISAPSSAAGRPRWFAWLRSSCRRSCW